MKIKIKIFSAIILFLLFIGNFFVNSSRAASCGNTRCESGENIFNCKTDCLGPGVPTKSLKVAIHDATGWLLGFATGICVLMLIVGGFYYITSSGDQEQATNGKKIVKYSLLGLVIVGISYALIKVISDIIT